MGDKSLTWADIAFMDPPLRGSDGKETMIDTPDGLMTVREARERIFERYRSFRDVRDIDA